MADLLDQVVFIVNLESLTLVQQRAVQFAIDSGGELQLGGAMGRPVRRDVAKRLERMGILDCVHQPSRYANWWVYRLAPAYLPKPPELPGFSRQNWKKSVNLATLAKPIQEAIGSWVSLPTGVHPNAEQRAALLSQVQTIAKAWGGECLSADYLGMQKHLVFRCAEGYVWKRTPTTLLAGYFCPECENRSTKTLQRLKAWATAKGWRCLSTHFVDSTTPMHWRCDQGHEWFSSPQNVRLCKGCPECYRQRHYHTLETMHELAKSRGGLCLSTRYKNVDHKITWQCHRGHVWAAPPSRVMLGSWCPQCAIINRFYRPGGPLRKKYGL
jgi:hypothetical protein